MEDEILYNKSVSRLIDGNKIYHVTSNFKLWIMCTLYMIVGVMLCMIVYQFNITLPNFNKQIINSDCSNQSLIDTSKCLNNQLKQFYNYTITEDKDRSIEEIKKYGDCYDYTRFYKLNFESLGFYTKQISIQPDKGNGHTFLIVWDKNLTTYCKMDMELRECVEF